MFRAIRVSHIFRRTQNNYSYTGQRLVGSDPSGEFTSVHRWKNLVDQNKIELYADIRAFLKDTQSRVGIRHEAGLHTDASQMTLKDFKVCRVVINDDGGSAVQRGPSHGGLFHGVVGNFASRHKKSKFGTNAGLALDADRSTHQFAELPCYAQAEAGSTIATRRCLIRLREDIEDLTLLF